MLPVTPESTTPTKPDPGTIVSAIVSATLLLLCAVMVVAADGRQSQPVLQVIASSEPGGVPPAAFRVVAEPDESQWPMPGGPPVLRP